MTTRKEPSTTIAIIGGGVSGTLTALHLCGAISSKTSELNTPYHPCKDSEKHATFCRTEVARQGVAVPEASTLAKMMYLEVRAYFC